MTNLQWGNVQLQESKIIQACNVQECRDGLSNIPQDAVIMIDIDDTIIKPASQFFNKTSYKTLIDDIKREKGKYLRYETLLSNWRLQRKVVLVDHEWPSTLATLKQHYRVYGLTRMDTGKFGAIPSMEEWRYQELKALGIHFRYDNILENYQYITDFNFTNKPLFYHGIFMTGSASKSQTIGLYKQILATSYFVVIDDKEENLRDIEDYCWREGFSFLGIRFVGAYSDKQDDVGTEVAQFQKKHFLTYGQWLEDDEAILYMNKNKESF